MNSNDWYTTIILRGMIDDLLKYKPLDANSVPVILLIRESTGVDKMELLH